MSVPKRIRPPASDEPNATESSKLLTVAETPLEADLMVARLRQAGVRAGRGARFYVPGWVMDDLSIFVLESDYELARQVLGPD
jgi:hypothetical protein